MAEVFLDASYAIALSAPSDQHHHRARELAERLVTEGTRLVTTLAVVLEIGNALAKQRYREAASVLLTSLRNDPSIDIVALSEDLYTRGLALYQERHDKEWGLTDCVSFIVMRERGLNEALTARRPFPTSRLPGTAHGDMIVRGRHNDS